MRRPSAFSSSAAQKDFDLMRLSVAIKLCVVSAVVAVAITSNARGYTLTIGAAVPITSVDPHFHNLTPNIAASKHVFDTLVRQDASQRLIPGFALSWRAVAPTTWEIKLRAGVKWHDGSLLKAEDIAFTLKRAPTVPNSPGSFVHHRRCGSPEAARRGDEYRHGRCRRCPLALPGQHLGDSRQGHYEARTDENTLAMNASPAK